VKLRSLLVFCLLALAGCGGQSAGTPTAAGSPATAAARTVPTGPPATAAVTAVPTAAMTTATPTAPEVAARSRIAYVQTADRASGEYDLYVMKPDGSDRRQLTSLPGIETSPAAVRFDDPAYRLAYAWSGAGEER
jgi:hypothetical protein